MSNQSCCWARNHCLEVVVPQESQCLKHLILTNVSLKGRSFQQLLVDEEQHRFLEFIHTSTQTLGTPESKDFLPLCLRVSFRGSAGGVCSFRRNLAVNSCPRASCDAQKNPPASWAHPHRWATTSMKRLGRSYHRR